MSRPPSSLDRPLSPGDIAPRVATKDVDRHRTDDTWDGDAGEPDKFALLVRDGPDTSVQEPVREVWYSGRVILKCVTNCPA
jgi:hypothetical protein